MDDVVEVHLSNACHRMSQAVLSSPAWSALEQMHVSRQDGKLKC